MMTATISVSGLFGKREMRILMVGLDAAGYVFQEFPLSPCFDATAPTRCTTHGVRGSGRLTTAFMTTVKPPFSTS